jgi:hypothetical protein
MNSLEEIIKTNSNNNQSYNNIRNYIKIPNLILLVIYPLVLTATSTITIYNVINKLLIIFYYIYNDILM